MSHRHQYHGHHHGECDYGSKSHHHENSHKGSCGTSACDWEESHHHSGGRGCCETPELVRRYESPEERKEKLEKYIDDLKKELSGAESELKKL